MIRGEAAGRGTKTEGRERWRFSVPVFEEALERLTGTWLAGAEEAEAWVKEHR
jgi:hypothetical protein